MFVLRIIDNHGEEDNHILGESYSVIRRGNPLYDELVEDTPYSYDEVATLIKSGDTIYALPRWCRAYVMYSNGATFAKIDTYVPSRKDIDRTIEVWKDNVDR